MLAAPEGRLMLTPPEGAKPDGSGKLPVKDPVGAIMEPLPLRGGPQIQGAPEPEGTAPENVPEGGTMEPEGMEESAGLGMTDVGVAVTSDATGAAKPAGRGPSVPTT